MQKIGFYGGCFNPPTIAHIELAKQAISEYKLDKLYFVPVGNAYKKNNLADAKQRIKMLEIAIRDCKTVEIMDIETKQEKDLKANEVFKLIEKRFSTTQNFFIMGADNFINLDKWENSEELIKNFRYIILQRKGINIKPYIKGSKLLSENKKNFNILKNKQINMSSTLVRELIGDEEYIELEKYLDINVIEYIRQNNLYKNPLMVK